MKNLHGKAAFVTGGASGIGLGMAQAFLAAGMRVTIADVRKEHLERAGAALAGAGELQCVQLDVTDREAMRRAADAAERAFGNIHVVCNNAGVGVLGHIRLVHFDDWDWCLGVNLGGVVNGVQTFLPRMLAHGEEGHIVNTSSIGAILPGPGGVPYLTAKAAILGLTQALHADLADVNIGVSVLIPGPTATNIHQVASLRPERFADTGLNAVESKLAEGPLFSGALDPAIVGEKVLHAIRNKTLYIMTHGEFKTGAQHTFQAILDAFPAFDAAQATGMDEQVTRRIQDLVSFARDKE